MNVNRKCWRENFTDLC